MKRSVPPAYAVLNPNQKGCNYPDKNLRRWRSVQTGPRAFSRARKGIPVNAFLKIVAIGTVADVAKLTARIEPSSRLVKDLAKATNPGLRH